MRRTLVTAGSFTLLLGSATGVAAADGTHGGDHGGGFTPVVVANGLNSPRQLSWAGDTLLIAEAGQGGADCAPTKPEDPVCAGPTGRISAVPDADHTFNVNAETLVGGLFSVETAEGTIGSDGVAWTGFPGAYLIAEGEQTFDALAKPGFETDDPAAETQEHLLVSVGGQVFPWVDLGKAERQQNPDKAQLDSNPNAVIVVDPTPTGEPGNDEYVLVADAGANTVWKVTADFTDLDKNGLPAATVTVFATYPPGDGPDAPEFVPSALDQDKFGNIYVGGVGSFVPGGAAVVRYDSEGNETARWDGFTAINGLAVADDGGTVYVSQIFGNGGAGTGNVIRVDTRKKTWAAVDVPFPSGLAVDDSVLRHSGHGPGDNVFVSAFSLSPADADDPTTPDVVEGGQVWRFTFPEHADESPLPVTPPSAG
jgi:hypothetical protein